MKNSKVFSVVPVLLGLITVFSLSGTLIVKSQPKIAVISADYPSYSDIESISRTADVIVKGEVIKVYDPQELKIGESTNYVTNEKEPMYEVYTVSDVKVTKVLKGNVKPNDVIKIKQLGGIYKNIKYISDGTTYLETKGNHVLFLQQYDNSPYSLLNPNEANIKIERKNANLLNKDAVIKTKNRLVKEGTSEEDLFKSITESLK